MTTPLQAKQDDKRERDANRRGLQSWQADAAEAVDNKLMSDIVRDNIRPGPSQEEITEAIQREKERQREREAFQAGIPEVLRLAGYDPATVDENNRAWAERFLSECGGHVGAAANKLMGMYRKR